MSPKRKAPNTTLPAWVKVVVAILIPSLSYLGGALSNNFMLSNNLATKPYVDERHSAALKYTDDKSSQALKEAIDHSEFNRQTVMVEIRGIASKQDIILDSVKALQLERYKSR